MNVAEQFRAWRDSRRRGEKIPLALWQRAVALCGQYSLETIATSLGVDLGRLEKRVAAKSRVDARSRPSEPCAPASLQGFVEVGTLDARYMEDCTIEAIDRNGRRVSVHLKGRGCAQASEIATHIVTLLWSNR